MPILGKSRKDSEFKGKGLSANEGFTIIELLIVLSIIVIVATTILPQITYQTDHRPVSKGAAEISEFLANARLEANIRQAPVALSYQWYSRSDWCLGMSLDSERCDCTSDDSESPSACLVDSDIRVLRSMQLEEPNIMTAMPGDGIYVFRPGTQVPYDATGRRAYDGIELDLETADSRYALDVRVSTTGKISTCAQSKQRAVPGFKECLR